MFCQKCGKEINEATAFCPHCGNSLSPAQKQSAPKKTGRARKIIGIVAFLICVPTFIYVLICESGFDWDVFRIKSCSFGNSQDTIGEIFGASSGFPSVEWRTGVNMMGKKLVKAQAIREDGVPCSMTFMRSDGGDYALLEITVNKREYSGLNAAEVDSGLRALRDRAIGAAKKSNPAKIERGESEQPSVPASTASASKAKNPSGGLERVLDDFLNNQPDGKKLKWLFSPDCEVYKPQWWIKEVGAGYKVGVSGVMSGNGTDVKLELLTDGKTASFENSYLEVNGIPATTEERAYFIVVLGQIGEAKKNRGQ